MPHYDGLIALPAVGETLLKLTKSESDPVAKAKVRDRRVRCVLAKNPELAVRVGGRFFVLNQEPKLRAFAVALDLSLPAPKPARARRAPSSNSGAAVAA
ncbi:hypothetical protein [Muricoccus aerilatus]|uniref:hypothetical protein n=1 Tax=Muricoccus aerilatus TaxID=452982 RepID=UPI0005C14B39|nr:hypothetical protein [Roseomonas aerilata]